MGSWAGTAGKGAMQNGERGVQAARMGDPSIGQP
jgi:hypothetical protein